MTKDKKQDNTEVIEAVIESETPIETIAEDEAISIEEDCTGFDNKEEE